MKQLYPQMLHQPPAPEAAMEVGPNVSITAWNLKTAAQERKKNKPLHII